VILLIYALQLLPAVLSVYVFFSLKSWLPLVEQMAVFVKYYHTVAV